MLLLPLILLLMLLLPLYGRQQSRQRWHVWRVEERRGGQGRLPARLGEVE